MIPAATLAHLRAQTPGLRETTHFNHAGSSLMARSTLEAIEAHLRLEASLGSMEAGLKVIDRLEQLRADAARLLNAASDEIAVTTSCSHGFGSAFAALPPLRAGDRILVGRQEWGGSLATLDHAARRAGARIDVMPTQPNGRVDAQGLARCIDDRVRLLSLTWLPANGGLIHDAEAVGRIASDAGVPYFIDAAQAVGQIPVDVRALRCDVLCCPGRKHLRGPRGTGLLYVRRGFLERLDPAWRDVFSAPLDGDDFALRKDARRFETSEKSVALQLGLGQALSEALAVGLSAIAAETAARAETLRERLRQVPGLVLLDPEAGPRSGLVTFNLPHHRASEVRDALASQRIHIAAVAVPFTPLDMRARGLESIARASVSYLNTDEDVDRLANALERLR